MTSDRPLFTLTFRPEPGVDAIKALRAALKELLRRHGLRCVSAVAHIATEGSSQ
jgi:hypothetical protein